MEQEKQMLPAETKRADDKLVVMMVNQKNRTTKKEEEPTRKAEELRMAEETSRLNEQCLFEEQSEVKELLERPIHFSTATFSCHNHNSGFLNSVIGHKFGKALGCFSFNPVSSGSGKESDLLFRSINIVGYSFAYLHYVFVWLYIYESVSYHKLFM